MGPSGNLFLLKCLVSDLLFDLDADDDRGADEGEAGDCGARASGRSGFSQISQKCEVYHAYS